MTEKESSRDKREELTPKQLQRRKKMMVYPLLFLLFAGVMWLIFAPSKSEESESVEGFNHNIPMPKEQSIVGDKREAYQQEEAIRKEREKMLSLQDFSSVAQANGDSYAHLAPVPVDYNDSYDSYQSRDELRASTRHLQNINEQLGSFYDDSNVDDEREQMAERIANLEKELEQERDPIEEQLELMERSYQLAAKYLPSGEAKKEVESKVSEQSGRSVKIEPVSQVNESVVSSLSQPLSNREFAESYGTSRNWSFNTAVGQESEHSKNSVLASVYRSVTVADGESVQFRLLEPLWAGRSFVPRNTLLTGAVKISGERMNIVIEYINNEGTVIPVEMEIYDMDGNPGISIPNSAEISALKEVAANMGSSLGTSVTISKSAGSQIASDLGKGVIQGTSQYINKKISTIRVTLKAGYRVMLLPSDR